MNTNRSGASAASASATQTARTVIPTAIINEIALVESERIKKSIDDRDYFYAVVTTYRLLGQHKTAQLFISAVEEQRRAMAMAA